MAGEILRRMGAQSGGLRKGTKDDHNINYVKYLGEELSPEALRRLLTAAETGTAGTVRTPEAENSTQSAAQAGTVTDSYGLSLRPGAPSAGWLSLTAAADAEAVSEQLRRDCRRYDGGFIQY